MKDLRSAKNVEKRLRLEWVDFPNQSEQRVEDTLREQEFTSFWNAIVVRWESQRKHFPPLRYTVLCFQKVGMEKLNDWMRAVERWVDRDVDESVRSRYLG